MKILIKYYQKCCSQIFLQFYFKLDVLKPIGVARALFSTACKVTQQLHAIILSSSSLTSSLSFIIGIKETTSNLHTKSLDPGYFLYVCYTLEIRNIPGILETYQVIQLEVNFHALQFLKMNSLSFISNISDHSTNLDLFHNKAGKIFMSQIHKFFVPCLSAIISL